LGGYSALGGGSGRCGHTPGAPAAQVFGVGEDAVSREQRAAAKALNFGLMYGMGAPGFARATGLTVPAAQDVMRRYFETFPRVAAWLEEAEAAARRTGRARTPLGRIRSLTGDGIQPTATLARNAPIQGAGADMTKLALAAVARRVHHRFGTLAGQPDPDGLVLVIHDELVAEVPAAAGDEAAALVEEGMLEAAAEVLGDIPADVDVALQPRWATPQVTEE
jgi:DNA polymerase I